MIKRFLGSPRRRAVSKNDLIKREAQLGGTIFGPVPKGHERQFFSLDAHTWIWHESWMQGRSVSSITTRYEVRGDKVFKTQNNHPMRELVGEELSNLAKATAIYKQLIGARLYPELMKA
jgi:hypothetical protein